MKKAVAVIAMLLFLVILAALVFFCYTITDKFQTAPQLMLLRYNGNYVVNNSHNNVISTSCSVEVVYLFPFLTNEKDGVFDVSIIPCADFVYFVHGEKKYFSDIQEDLASFFNINIASNKITFDARSIENVLMDYHKTSEIIFEDATLPTGDTFCLSVVSGTGNSQVKFYFSTLIKSVGEISLDKTEVVF